MSYINMNSKIFNNNEKLNDSLLKTLKLFLR